jgi:hypothetical protein
MSNVTPKLKMRNQQITVHHLFKALLAKFYKNTSFIRGQVRVDHIEHVHHFHSVNSLGMPQKFTTTVGGHFHEVEWKVNAEGELQAKCGPPLRKVQKVTSRGVRTITEPVVWREEGGENENGQLIEPHDVKDTHTHELVYIGSDELSRAKIEATQEKSAALISASAPKMPEDFDVAEATTPRAPKK